MERELPSGSDRGNSDGPARGPAPGGGPSGNRQRPRALSSDVHYEPKHLFIGNIEYDHADLYPDLDSVSEAFARLVEIVPPEGTIVANAEDKRVLDLLPIGRARIARVSAVDPREDFSATDIEFGGAGTVFTLLESGRPAGRLASPLFGLHNVRNVLGAIALARGLGLEVSEIDRALAQFKGVRRRLEVKGEKNGILVVDDFAHHPTAVEGTLAAARTRWPGRRIWALFEPRSNTAGRKMFEEDYDRAFSAADAIVIAPIFHAKRLPPEGLVNRPALAHRFAQRGKPAFAPAALEEIPEIVKRETRPGDVLLLMSSGAFGGLPEALLDEL